MASNTLKTVFDVDGSSWSRLVSRIKGDITSIAQSPGRAFAGVLGGAGLAAGAFAARAFIRSPQDIMDAHTAAQLSEGQIGEGQLWDLMLKERSKLLDGVVSGEASNIASILAAARRDDPRAQEIRARFLGGEGATVQDAMLGLPSLYRTSPGVIQEEMRQIFTSLANEVARNNMVELMKHWSDPDRQKDMQKAADVALEGFKMARKFEEISVAGAGRGIGRTIERFDYEAGNIPEEVPEVIQERSMWPGNYIERAGAGGGGFGPGNPVFEELMGLERRQTSAAERVADAIDY